MALDAYDPTETRDPYYPDVDSTRANARLWSIDKLALDLAAVGIVQIFTGAGSNPTGLTGYATSKLWLQVSSGVTDAPATLRVYDGSGDATLEASWPTLASQGAAGLRRHLSVYSQAEVDALVTAGVPAGFGSDDVENDSGVTGATVTAALDALKTLADAAVPTSTKGQPNGVASLDSGGKIPIGQIPASLTAPLKFQGTWNAATNTPTLASGTGTEGHVYRVSTAGTTSLDGEASWEVGDELYFDGTVWNKLSASGGDVTITLPTSSIDGRVIVGPTSNQSGGGKFGMAATADGRVLVWGDVAVFAFNPVGDAYGAYELALPWNPATVSVEKIYVGQNYALVLTDEATENLYAMGGNDDGQCGQGNTTAQTALVKVTGLTGIHIQQVWTEADRAEEPKFWFALSSTGTLYSCGYSGPQHVMGYNNTADLTTPRLMTESDGTTPLANIVGLACDTHIAPVLAWTSSNTLYRWGAGTDGAHGDNSSTALAWPALLETTPGSGTDRTDIASAVVTGSNVAAARANAWILTTAGKVEVAGNRAYGSGDGVTSATDLQVFTPAAGAIDAETVVSLHAGGGEYCNCVAIDSDGNGWLVGRLANEGLLGDGSTTDLNTFTPFSGLPTDFAGNLTNAVVAGGNTSTAIYLEATISGVKKLAAIGYDTYYGTGKNTSGTAAAAQTWGLVQGAWGTLTSWGVYGTHNEYGLWTLNSDGEMRYCGRNDQGQAGMRHAPGVMANIPILQRVDLGIPRLLKPPTNRGAYSAVVEYSKQDVVTQSGSSWVYVNETAGTGNAPPTLPTTSNSYWRLLAAKGDAGFASVGFIFEGGETAIEAGEQAMVPVPFDCTIVEATLLAKATGSIVVDVWKDTFANYPPTDADSITASAQPTLSSAQKYSDGTLTGWTTAISAGDILVANVDSASGLTYAQLILKVQRI